MDIIYIGENLLPGKLGHASVIASFLGALVSFISYFIASRGQDEANQAWRKLGRYAYLLHGIAVIGIVLSLFDIIANHRFEYHYAWSHASSTLPLSYVISSFWEGQEGSFLLWTFWHVIIGVVLMFTSRRWESPVMMIIALAQVTLSSMLLGVYVLGYKVGSSPFMLLREVMEAPIFNNPNYTALIDGNGLNPLLQNPWMVIHPPVLFLGFGLTVVPFAYAVAGLYKKEYSNWMIPAQPYAIFGVLVLGIGIMMGAMWAYESLNFGGFWAWDPVENASLIPWLTLVGGVHTLIAFRRSGQSGVTTFILFIATFILILYATFLTRSGILGDSSVHAFTDLGMSGQLLVFLGIFVLISLTLLVIRWKHIPRSTNEEKTYSREFWLFVGSLVLILASFQIFTVTSIPVFNKIFGTNYAPPINPISTYNTWQLPLAILVLIFSVFGQYLKYKDTDSSLFCKKLIVPFSLSIVFTLGTAISLSITNWQWNLLLFAGYFSITGNGLWLFEIRKKIKVAGSGVAHIGFAMMMIGALISAGKQEVISLNQTGLSYGDAFDDKNNRENILLWKNQPLQMGEYRLTYVGDSTEAPNTYYKVLYEKLASNGAVKETFYLYPFAQINPKMGLIASPDTRNYWNQDIYTHVSQVPDKAAFKNKPKYQEPVSLKFDITKGDTIMLGERLIIYLGANKRFSEEMTELVKGSEAAIAADIVVKSFSDSAQLSPVFALKQGVPFRFDAESEDAGIKASIRGIEPSNGQITIDIQEKNPALREYIIMKAIRFPFIGVLWIGTMVMLLGLAMAIMQRYHEAKRLEAKADAA